MNNLRVIELSSRTSLSGVFSKCDHERYLALVKDRGIYKDQLVHPFVYPYRRIKEIRRTESDFVVMSGAEAGLAVWFFENYRYARYIGVHSTAASLLAASLGIIKNLFLRKIKFEGILALQGINSILVFSVIERPSLRNRRFISPLLGVDGFIGKLQEMRVNYAVLRWFGSFKNFDLDEDLDLLVADNDIKYIEEIFSHYPGILPCDLYSASGLSGSDYNGMAYYPPPLAEEILSNSVLENGVRVPNKKDYFFSLLYHVVYHKGRRSGVPSTEDKSGFRGEHDYAAILGKLAMELGYRAPATLEDMEKILGENGWRPPNDTLRKLSNLNDWVRVHFGLAAKNGTVSPPDKNKLAVFLIRAAAVDFGMDEKIVQLLKREGFSILYRKSLSKEEIKSVQHKIRGGNWGRGPWPYEGGPMAEAVFAYDLLPITPSEKDRETYPALGNARVLAKTKIRDNINILLPEERQCNMLHSSDNGEEAEEYLEILAPELRNTIHKKIEALEKAFSSDDFVVVKDLTHNGRRAKVELVEYKGAVAVKKTFKPDHLDALANECFVMREFSNECSFIPHMLEEGHNYFIVPFYQNELSVRFGRLLPLPIAKKAIEGLRFFYKKGYCLVDAHPTNLIFNTRDGLKFIDFEFLYKYDKKPASFLESYDIAGVPKDFSGAYPIAASFDMRNYEKSWLPSIGLSLYSLINDPLWLQMLKRLYFQATFFPSVGIKKMSKVLRRHLRSVFVRALRKLDGVLRVIFKQA